MTFILSDMLEVHSRMRIFSVFSPTQSGLIPKTFLHEKKEYSKICEIVSTISVLHMIQMKVSHSIEIFSIYKIQDHPRFSFSISLFLRVSSRRYCLIFRELSRIGHLAIFVWFLRSHLAMMNHQLVPSSQSSGCTMMRVSSTSSITTWGKKVCDPSSHSVPRTVSSTQSSIPERLPASRYQHSKIFESENDSDILTLSVSSVIWSSLTSSRCSHSSHSPSRTRWRQRWSLGQDEIS